jgi:cell division protein FtsQ
MRRMIPWISPTGGKTPQTRRQNRKPQRRPAAPRWRRPALYAVGLALVFGAAAGGAWWVWTSGTMARLADRTVAAVIDVTVAAGLTVDEVLVEGRTESTRDQLLAAIGVKRNDPILAIDTGAIRDRILALGWVADAVVQRRLPGTLFVSIEERKAIAIWQHKGKFVLIDAGGAVIGTDGMDRYSDLKIVVGNDAPKHATELLEMLATAPQLMQRVRAAVWVGDRRWNLRLDDGIDIQLPETEPQMAWARLVQLDRDRQLLSQNVIAVDLRFGDRLVVQRRDPGKST